MARHITLYHIKEEIFIFLFFIYLASSLSYVRFHILQDIVAVGVTNQRESVIVWNRHTGEPIHNAIIWLDNRTTTTVDDLIESIPNNSKNINYLKPLCGLPLSPYFSALKLRWLRDNVPAVKKAMDHGDAMFGTIGELS